MSQHDDHLPADLQDIAARLSEARAVPGALELDELRRRIHGPVVDPSRAPRRRGFAHALRMKFVAAALTGGLVLTTGVGVVLACTTGPPPPPVCQYTTPWTETKTYNPVDTYNTKTTLTVTLDWTGSILTYSITYTGPSFTYTFAGGPTKTKTGAGTVSGQAGPEGTDSLTVVANSQTYTLPITYN